MTSLVVPTAVVALANQRLRDADEALSRKLNATTVNPLRGGPTVLAANRFGATERRILGLVRAAQSALGSDPAALPARHPLAPGPSRFAVLGAAGFEIAAFADLFSPNGPWRAEAMRRGTSDPNLSKVVVGTTQFAMAVGAKAVLAAGADAAAVQRARAFTLGLLGTVASSVVVGPVQRGIHRRRSPQEWTRHDPGPELAAVDSHLLATMLGGDPNGWTSWWPAPSELSPTLVTAYLEAIEEVYGLDKARPHGWPTFEERFAPRPAMTAEQAAAGYARLRGDQAAGSWSAFQWFGVLSPMLVAPSLSLALARLLPAASRFTSPGPLTERSVSELLTLTEGLCSIAPFAYSMFLWSQIPDHTEVFANALTLFLARAALVGTWIPTIGTDTEDPLPALRWIVTSLMLGTDIYALIRGIVARGDQAPGRSLVFFLQTMAGASAVATTGLAALLKVAGLDSEAGSWIAWAVLTAGLLFGAGIPISMALANGGGYLSWFRSDAHLSVTPAAAATPPAPPPAPAGQLAGPVLVFDDATLWFDPAVPTSVDPAAPRPDLTDLRYPSGPRPIVRMWWEGSGDLKIGHDANRILLRHDTTDIPVVLGPAQRSATEIVAALTAALAGVHAEVVDGDPAYDLPWPAILSDPGDGQPDRTGHDAHVGDLSPVGTTRDHAYLLRHTPRSELTTAATLRGPATSGLDDTRIAPNAELADLDDSAIGAAADLAVLLYLGAIPSLATVAPVDPDATLVPAAVAVPGPVGPVHQVFRQWNLDERRMNEWRMLVAGGAASEKNGRPAERDAAMRPDPTGAAYHSAAGVDGEPIANALGWVPLWRAWLRVASDTTADVDAPVTMPYAPAVRTADGRVLRPTNAQLTAGVRFLLDLP